MVRKRDIRFGGGRDYEENGVMVRGMIWRGMRESIREVGRDQFPLSSYLS